ncbi:MAG: DUF1801 domain-containing protein [Candidatus Peribacteraceae bacterium]|nr:DUF1801 domain-containing protein [Candidatus Peribacteraceae bacterium]
MFKATKAKTVKDYLRSVPDEQRETMEFLHEFIQRTAPSLKPYFATNMLGYGSFPYKNYKKEMIEWPTIGLASRKNSVSLYVCAVVNGKYIVETHKNDLGNVRVGKSCISLKTVSDLNLESLKDVLKAAEENPGLAEGGGTTK